MNKEEHNIQTQIVQFLNLKKILYFAVPNGVFFNSKTPYAYIKYLRAEGFKNGVSDLVLITKNKILFVEIKTLTGKQNSNQKQFEKDIKELGHEYVIWRSLDDCMRFFNLDNCKKIKQED